MAPSPDQSPYHPLTLFDRSPYDLAQRALADAGVKLPGWRPRAADPALTFIEAFALIVAEEVFAINRLPDAVMEVLMHNFGIERQLGTPARADVTFHLSDAAGHTLASGTVVRLHLDDETNIDFTTTSAVVAPAGATSVVAPVQAVGVGSEANGVPVGTPLLLMSPVAFVNSVTLATAPTDGSDPETDEDWRSRTVTRLDRLTGTLVVPKHFEDRALEDPVVGRAQVRDNWNVDGAANGHVTVAVADDQGEPLSMAAMGVLEDEMEAAALAMLDIHVIAPDYSVVNVTASVVSLPSAAAETVAEAARSALADYLSPGLWPWSGTVRRNELISLLDQVEGVDYVTDVLISTDADDPAAVDIALGGNFPLVRPGVIDVAAT